MTDIERGVQVYKVIAATDSEAIEIELEESLVRQTRVELDLRVAELDAKGKKAGKELEDLIMEVEHQLEKK